MEDRRTKYNYLEEHREEIERLYDKGRGLTPYRLSKMYGVTHNVMTYRLKKWGVYNSKAIKSKFEIRQDMEKEIIRDRMSGMTFRFLELKYGINTFYLSKIFKENNLKSRIPKRNPGTEELEKLLEDMNSELFFLDELSHFYCLDESVILKIAKDNKLVININYDHKIDFLMCRDDLTLEQIMNL